MRSEEIYGTYRLIFHCLASNNDSFSQPFLCFFLFFHSKKYCSEHQMIFTREVWFHQCVKKKKSKLICLLHFWPAELALFFRVFRGALAKARKNNACLRTIVFPRLHQPEKTADISRRHHWSPREMTSEKRAQKFHTDDAILTRSRYCL